MPEPPGARDGSEDPSRADVEPELEVDRRPGVLSRPGRRVVVARRRTRRRRRTVVIGLIVAVIAPFAVGAGWFWYELDPPGSPGGKVAVEVQEGWGVREIGDALQRDGVIGSSLVFQVYSKLEGAGPFQAGHYELRRGLGVRDAVTGLTHGPILTYSKLALPPGLTLQEIAARVGRLPGRSADKFLDVAKSGQVRSKYEPPEVSSLEGLTWPDTYLLDKKQDEVAILQMIVSRFDQEVDKLGFATTAPPAGVTQYQVLVVASLIQSEAKLDEDRPLISAVVYNRLRDGTPLQIDATVLYARGHRDGPITKADLDLESPYNTYKVHGLPPTPISTLAVVSIKAALAPADVPYRFYVLSDANGKHKFAVTLEEHQNNVAEARTKGPVP